MSTRSSGVGVDINVELVVLCRLVVPEGVSRYRGGLFLRGDRVLEDLRLLAGGMRHLIPIRTQRVQGVKPEHFLCASRQLRQARTTRLPSLGLSRPPCAGGEDSLSWSE